MTRDARQHPRFQVDLNVAVSIDERRIAARTRDLSRSGLCLIAEAAIPLDTVIGIELVLAFSAGGISEPLRLSGRAVWCTSLFGAYQVGVKFVPVGDGRERHLDMFIGLLDGSLGPAADPGGAGSDADESTDRRIDPDDPFQP
jgi:hypothetical protein